MTRRGKSLQSEQNKAVQSDQGETKMETRDSCMRREGISGDAYRTMFPHRTFANQKERRAYHGNSQECSFLPSTVAFTVLILHSTSRLVLMAGGKDAARRCQKECTATRPREEIVSERGLPFLAHAI